MRQKVKRYSRAAISVLLTLCMLVSCMTVGIIATDAAKVTADEAVGDGLVDLKDQNKDIYIRGEFNSWAQSDDWKLTQVNGNEYTGCFPVTGSGNQGFKFFADGHWYTLQGYVFNTNWNGDTGGDKGFAVDVDGNNMILGLGDTNTTVYVYFYLWLKYGNSGTGSRLICDFRKPYFHRAGSSSDFGTNNNVTNTQMNLKSGSTGVYTISNLPAGQYYINVDMDSTRQTDGIITSISTGTGVTSGSQLHNFDNKTYNFYWIKSDSTMVVEFNRATGVLSVNPAVSTVTLTKTGSDSFGIAKVEANGAVATLSSTADLPQGATATIKVKPTDSTKKATTYTVDETPRPLTYNASTKLYEGTFTVPNAATTAVQIGSLTNKTKYTVTYNANDSTKGTVTAVDEEGNTVENGSQVYEDTVVTFTGSATDGNVLYGWTGFTGNKTVQSKTITADTTVTGNFGKEGYKIVPQTGTPYAMTALSNGWYISKEIPKDNGITILRNADGKYANAGGNSSYYGWHDGYCGPEHKVAITWDSTTKPDNDSAYYSNCGGTTNKTLYLVYDPATGMVWTTTEPDALYPVTIYVKNGTVRKEDGNYTTTCLYGTSAVTGATTTSEYGGHVKKIVLTAEQVRSAQITITTTVNSDYQEKFYVKGFDVNGGLTQAVIAQEYDDNYNELTTYVDDPSAYEKIHNTHSNSFVLNLADYPDEVIEVTPIYFPRNSKSTDFIRFYAYDFTGDVKDAWDSRLAVYPYIEGGYEPYLHYPGQLMVNEGGVYYADIPAKDESGNLIQGLTMNNYTWDDVHYNKVLKSKAEALWGNDENGNYARKMYNRQTYDYSEFAIINKIFHDPDHHNLIDEDVIFSFKYKPEVSLENSNLGRSTYYKDSASDKQNTALDYRKSYSTLEVEDPQWKWENLTDYYKNRVDIFGQKVDIPYNEKAAYNPIRIVSNGYDRNATGEYATAWALYKPVNASGQVEWTGAVDHYELFEVIGGQGIISDGKATHQSESYLIDPDFSADIKRKYGETNPDVMDCERIPVMITYEYEGLSDVPNDASLKTKNDWGHRSDGRWYYSDPNQLITAHTLIEISDTKNNAVYRRDYYQTGNIDFESETGYDVEDNTGQTGITANFTNDNSFTLESRDYENVDGYTRAYALSNGKCSYDLTTAPDPDGNYTFEGWYLKNGDNYTLASREESFSVEAKTNDVYVARYYKTPAGSVKISHNLLPTSTGKGATLNSVKIVNASGDDVATIATSSATATTVGAKYIKDGSTDMIQIVLNTTPDNATFKDFWYDYTKRTDTAPASAESYTKLEDATSPFTVTVNKSGTTATITVPISYFFNDGEFEVSKNTIKFFSELEQITNNITITKTVDYANGEDFTFVIEKYTPADTEAGTEESWDPYSGSYTVGSDRYTIDQDGKITIPFDAGTTLTKTATILGVPAGTKFRIKESLAANTNYTFVAPVAITNGVTPEDWETTGKSFTMSATNAVNLTFTNNIKKTNVQVKKVVEDGDSGTQAFPITLSYTYPDDGATTGSKKVSLQHNQTTTDTDILTLPVGTVITVTEDLSSIDGYAANYTTSGTNITKNSNGTFTVTEQPSGTNGLITVTNKKLYDVNITKQIVKSASDKTADPKVQDSTTNFKFKIYEEVNSAWEEVTNSLTTRVYQSNGTSATYTDGAFVITKGQTVKVLGVAKGTKLRVVETDHIDSHYSYVDMDVANATGSAFKWDPTDTADADGTEFTVGEQNVNVTINNTPKRITVKIKKETDYPDDDGKDGSVFKIYVKTKPYNFDGNTVPDASGIVTSGAAPAPITDSSALYYDANDTTETGDGYYRVLKDGKIEFTDVPVGTFFEVTETYWGHSHVYGTQRFTTDYIHLTKDSTPTVLENHSGNTDFNNTSTPINEASTFTVRNKVKRASFSIKKEITDKTDTETTHELTVTMLRNGPGSPAQVNGTYESEAALIYRSSLDSSTDVKLPADGKINIHSGEVITFPNLPVGTYVVITETTPNGIYQFDQFIPSGVNVVSNPVVGSTIQLYTTDTNPNIANVIIQNKLQRKSLEITKAVNDNVSETNPYRIRVYTAQTLNDVNNDSWTEYTGTLAVKNSSPAATRTHSNTSGSEGYQITKGETLVMSNIAVNTFVKVVEEYAGEKHEWQSYSAGTTPSTSTMEGGTYFKMDSEKVLTINNKLIQRDIDITKTINNGVTDNQTDHKLKLRYAPNGDTNYDASVTLKNGAQTKIVNDDTEFTIKAGETWRLENAPIGAKLIIQESTPGTGYVFDTINVSDAATVTNSEGVYTLTVGTNDVSVDVRNYRVHDVTITKTVDDTSCTAYFPIKVNVNGTQIQSLTGYTFAAAMPTTTGGDVYFDDTNDVFMLKAGKSFTIKDLVENTTVDVLENTADFGNAYAYNPTGSNVTDDKGTPSTGGTYKGFTDITVDEDITVTIANKALHTVVIQKTTDEATNDTFNIQVFVGDNTNLISASGWTVALSKVTAASDHYVFEKDGKITISGVPYGTQFKVLETDGGSTDFKFSQTDSTVTGATKTVIADTDVYGYTFTTAHADVNAVVHNKEAAKYQYEIKYIYESYSAKTYQNNTNLTDDNRVDGEDRSYTQTGEISTDDLNTYFDKAVDGSLSFKSVVLRKNFISKFAPYEDDFMLSLVWDDQNPADATYVPDKKTIKLETRAASQLDRTVNVKFKLPYVSDSNLVPDANATYLDELYQKPLTTKYGNHVTNSSGNYVTAPLTLDKNGTTMYFQYWQIKSDYQNMDNSFTDADSKRCYYASFNMTMYQDSYVEAKYTAAQTDYNPSARSYADTENGEARINYIETSRNQWNSNGGNSTDGAKKYAGDRVYVDFLLTFGYKDLELSTLNNTDLKTGFVLEQVAELDIEDGKYVTKKESEYAAMYEGTAADKTAREDAVKDYINDKTNSTYADDLGTHTFKMDSTIALTTLDNKNQCKHSVDMASKTLNTDGTTLKESTLKNYVYRAYSYVKLADDTIQLSAPVYFTIYDVATIANGTNQ